MICLRPLASMTSSAAALARPHRLEHFLGDLAGDRVVLDAVEQPAERVRHRPGCIERFQAVAVQRTGQFADDPVGDDLRLRGVARGRLEVVGLRALRLSGSPASSAT